MNINVKGIECGEQYLNGHTRFNDLVKAEMARNGVFATDEDIMDAQAMHWHETRGFGQSTYDDLKDMED